METTLFRGEMLVVGGVTSQTSIFDIIIWNTEKVTPDTPGGTGIFTYYMKNIEKPIIFFGFHVGKYSIHT